MNSSDILLFLFQVNADTDLDANAMKTIELTVN